MYHLGFQFKRTMLQSSYFLNKLISKTPRDKKKKRSQHASHHGWNTVKVIREEGKDAIKGNLVYIYTR